MIGFSSRPVNVDQTYVNQPIPVSSDGERSHKSEIRREATGTFAPRTCNLSGIRAYDLHPLGNSPRRHVNSGGPDDQEAQAGSGGLLVKTRRE